MKYKKILIVDDSTTSRMIIKRCFFIAGYENAEYLEAEDGLAALSVLEGSDVDLIVSDLNMPRMDGVTLIKRLRMKEGKGSIPVLIISSIGNEAMEEELSGPSVLSVICKPLSPMKLVDVLGEGEDEF